jgi:hypothetical protein
VLAARGPALFALAGKGASFELLAPAGLALAALLIPLVVLYILKIQRTRKRVGSTWLWLEARRDLLARSPFRRLIAQLPLILQAIALLLLAFALARPATRSHAVLGDHVAIVIDASASMSARGPDGHTTRMDLARRAAKDALSELTPGSDAMVIEASRDARLVAPLDRDRVRAAAAIDRIAARDVEGDLGAAVALAVERLRSLGGSRRVVVVTDGNLARPASLSGVALPLDVLTVGSPVDNAGIVRVDVRGGTDPATNAEEVQGFLVVANFGKTPRELFVTMREEAASDVLASRRVLLAPGERQPVVLTFKPSPGDYGKGLVFDIAPHDAMPIDDEAYARVPAGDKLPVVLAGSGEPWIERALASDPMVDLKTMSLAELATSTTPADAFVVVDGACPADAPGADLLIVHPPEGACFGASVGRVIEAPPITSWESGDPRLRFLTLDGVHLARSRALKPASRAGALVRSQEDALAADASTATRTVTLLGFDVGESDWPLKASFVLFLRNLTELARAHRASGVAGPTRAGEPLRVAVPSAATSVAITGPDGAHVEAAIRGGLAIAPEASRAGFYHVSYKTKLGGGAIVVPSNLTSAAESDLSSKPLATDPAATVVAAGEDPEAHSDWSWVLALVAFLFVLFDVWYFTRDPRRPLIPRPADLFRRAKSTGAAP